jgi:hypothetical protein
MCSLFRDFVDGFKIPCSRSLLEKTNKRVNEKKKPLGGEKKWKRKHKKQVSKRFTMTIRRLNIAEGFRGLEN